MIMSLHFTSKDKGTRDEEEEGDEATEVTAREEVEGTRVLVQMP